MQKTGLCQICQKNEVDIYVITPQGESMEVCRECNNELTARYLGITLEPFRNGIYDFTGIRGRKHKFMIHKIIHPVGIGYQAVEVTENNTPGFRVEVLDELGQMLNTYEGFQFKLKIYDITDDIE